MNSTIITQSLKYLANKRPFFWSEADFQFAFSEALRVYLPNAKIRLERPIHISTYKTYHVDIWVEDEGKIYPIELKYKTKECSTIINGEKFQVADQSAKDLGRYDYIADIKRIEDIKNKYTSTFGEGYAIILTNDASYYNVPNKQPQTMDAQFRIHQGAHLSGHLYWHATPSSTTIVNGNRKSRTAITLLGNYTMDWNLYSNIKDISGTNFEVKSCVTVIK